MVPNHSSNEQASNGRFTAAQLASALDSSKRTVLDALKLVPAFKVSAGGNEANAWQFDQLPARFQERVAQHAFRNGLSVAEYLDSSARQWEPALAFERLQEDDREAARKLQAALLPTLKRLDEEGLSRSEIWRMGVEDHRGVYGIAISEKALREKANTIRRRARWDGDFERPELYIEKQPRRAEPQAKPIPDEFRILKSLIDAAVKNRQGAELRKQIFDDAFQVLEQMGSGREDRRRLVEFLWDHAPFVAKTREALRRNFDLLFERWREGGGMLASLDDKRRGRERGPVLTDDERVALIAYAAKYGGGRNQGWREAIKAKKLREEVVTYYSNSPRRMPRKIREQITGYVDDAKMRMHGPRHVVLKGPYISRDPNHPAGKLHSGDWDQSDDLTFINVMWDILPNGELYVGQPQLLLWVDERSWLPLGFVLIPDRHYNSFDIRNSWTRKCDEHGLPRKGLYLEGGFWQTARAWVGVKDEVAWSDTEQGIRRLGVRIEHARQPKGKIIERIFGKLQNYLQAEPGYVGRNALTDRYEEVQKQLRLVKSGTAKPGDFGWLSKDEWHFRLGELLTIYSNEPGEGKYLDGLTPKQAYETHFSTPLARIPDECRYLLACNKFSGPDGKGIQITSNGLCFRFRSRVYRYKDERLTNMRLAGKAAIAWFNPENPEFCGVTDENGENPIMAKRETTLPNHDAPAEMMEQASMENARMERPAKEVFAQVKHVFKTDFENRRFRPLVLADSQAVETNAEFRRQEREQTAESRETLTAVRRARKAGIALSADDPQARRKMDGLEMMRSAGIQLPGARTTEPELDK